MPDQLIDGRTDEAAAEAIVDGLRAAQVRAVKVVVVDGAGVHRVKCIPVERLPEVIRAGVGMSTLLSVWAVDDAFASTSFAGPDHPCDDLRLIPDLSACVPLAAEPGWAWCPADQHTQDGAAWGACPRGFLKRMVAALAGVAMRLSAAFETEWYLLAPAEDSVPINQGPGYSAVATTGAPFLLDLMTALSAAGIDVQQVHAEYSPGQYEVSVGPRDAVQAADTTILVRQTIRGVANAHRLTASFAPKVHGELLGSGAHLHLSLWDPADRNLFAEGSGPLGMTPEAEAFTAGILQELPALVAITAPSTVSYARLRPGRASGAFRAWGHENREAALRVVTGMIGTRASASNVEYKPADGAANPYLAVGCLIAAGIEGVRTGATLPPPTGVAPESLSDDERDSLGIDRLPTTLGEAIEGLEASATIRAAMGEVLYETFLATRKLEWETYRSMDEDALLRAHRGRY